MLKQMDAEHMREMLQSMLSNLASLKPSAAALQEAVASSLEHAPGMRDVVATWLQKHVQVNALQDMTAAIAAQNQDYFEELVTMVQRMVPDDLKDQATKQLGLLADKAAETGTRVDALKAV